jgi:hypothetical protein
MMPNSVLFVACESLVAIAVLARVVIRKNWYLTIRTGRATNAFSAHIVIPLVLIALAGVLSIVLLMRMLGQRGTTAPQTNLYDSMRKHLEVVGGVDLPEIPRGPMREPPNFSK